MMNTSVGTNMLKQLCLKLASGSVCYITHIVLMPCFFLSMIRPTLEYCGVWGCCGEVNSGTLETLQKRVGRIVIKTSRSDTAMKALRWPSLRSRRDEHILKLVRKGFTCPVPSVF